MRTGIANLPLHQGRAPAWLFGRMVRLGRQVLLAMAEAMAAEEILARLADPFWFQSLGCLLGFDWHSSGVTTTTCGALKQGIRGLEAEIGLWIAGGKGAVSRRTPAEVRAAAQALAADPDRLVYASRMAAKVDSAALQDGFTLYQHTFLFTRRGAWAVVQQGMDTERRMARRYHWLGAGVRDFVEEPHAAVCCDRTTRPLNLTAVQSREARGAVAALAREAPDRVVGGLRRLREMNLPRRHRVLLADVRPERLASILEETYREQPRGFEALLARPGVGPKTVRALALLAELLYGAPASTRDPVRFSFAHGGKDGHPYPVDRRTYDTAIAVLERAVRRAALGQRGELQALRRLERWARGAAS